MLRRFPAVAIQILAYIVIVFAMSFVVVGMAIMSACSWTLDRLGVENPVAKIIADDFHY